MSDLRWNHADIANDVDRYGVRKGKGERSGLTYIGPEFVFALEA